MTVRGFFLLGAPLGAGERRLFEDALLSRFGGDAEKAQAYMDKVLDRQINKARGLLSATSILAGIAIYVGSTFATLMAFASILCMLDILFVRWSATPSYATAHEDFLRTCRLCYSRSILVTLAIASTFLSVCFLVPHIIVLARA